MKRQIFLGAFLFFQMFLALRPLALESKDELSGLKKDQELSDFRVAHVYSDADGKIVAAKFRHLPSGAPVFLLQIESIPQAFMWVDTPVDSNKGVPHSLEHLIIGKGSKGRYFNLLREMNLGLSRPATYQDYNYYGLSCPTGIDDFFLQLHAWLDALYHPDFTDTEAEREFYHFGVSSDPATKRKALIEKGTVYDEMLSYQDVYTYFLESNRQALGEKNPFGFLSSGSPDEMRGVTPEEIRIFHSKFYSLGPTTGFIFVLDPREHVRDFLGKISQEFQPFIQPGMVPLPPESAAGSPKYPIHSSEGTEPKIFRFPAANESTPGVVRFSWRPIKTESMVELKLLQLFFRRLAQGEKSLLYESLVDSKTRDLDSGATTVDSTGFLGNSPAFPLWNVEVSGIPGNRISLEQVAQLRTVVLDKIKEVSQYPDGSENLSKFNELVASDAEGWHRTEGVWVKNPPGFGFPLAKTEWKDFFSYLEMDPSFIRSISEEPVWLAVDERLHTQKNVWHDLIHKFHLLDTPYANASTPSPQLLERVETEKQERNARKTKELLVQYGTSDAQEALSRFEQDELVKTGQIEAIAATVARPRLTEHPPLTLDDGLRYREFRLLGTVPVIASIFARPPTISMNLAFDLHKVPRKYYKYLPLLPRCLDSLGLDEGGNIVPYTAMMAKIEKEIYRLRVTYESNALSKRADLTISAYGADTGEFRRALSWVRRIMESNYLDQTNADRLRDIVTQRLSVDDSYTKQIQQNWIENSAYAFRYQDDQLFLAVGSHFTEAHSDERLHWLLHKPVNSQEIDKLEQFANQFLPLGSITSRKDLAQKLAASNDKGLEGELVLSWKRNISSFPESELISGLRQLAQEAQEDLKIGPGQAIQDLKTLQRIVLNRRAVHLDLTLSEKALQELTGELTGFLKRIPDRQLENNRVDDHLTRTSPIIEKLMARYPSSSGKFPLYLGLTNVNAVNGAVLFTAEFPGYTQLEHSALIRILASKLLSGEGPQTFFMKATEAGLAYNSGVNSFPGIKTIEYYADRIPDIPSLLDLVNSAAPKITDLHDPLLVDYALRQTFSVPRSVYAPSQRGWLIARDVRDGNSPNVVRRFSEGMLRLRKNPNLSQELTQAGLRSISPVLLNDEFKGQQQAARSMFFFVGSGKTLDDVEKRLTVPKLLRLWPSDYWIE